MNFVLTTSLSDLFAFAVLFGVGGAFLMVVGFNWLNQLFCKHEDVFETPSCDVVCSDCGKNLGFVGRYKGHSHG